MQSSGIIISDGAPRGTLLLRQHNRIPIYYSLAYHSLSFTKDDPNYCAKDFIDYLKKVGNIVPREESQAVSTQVLKVKDDRSQRELMQAVNLELVTPPPLSPSKAARTSSPTS